MSIASNTSDDNGSPRTTNKRYNNSDVVE